VTTPGSALRQYGLAVLTGLALPLAFSIWRVPWVAWIAVVPLLVALRRASPGQAILLGTIAGFLASAVGLRWLLDAGVTPGAFCILMGIAASRYALFALGGSLLYRHRPLAAAFAVPALWISLEWLQVSVGWLSIPWGLLGYSQYEVAPMLRAASVAGVYGISFVLLVGNVVLAESCERLGKRAALERNSDASRVPGIALAVVLAITVLAIGNFSQSVEDSVPRLRVAVVQAGVYQPSIHGVDDRSALIDRYIQLTREVAAAGDLDLVVWPESSVPVAFPYDQGALGMLFRLAEQIDTPLLVAASGREKMSQANPNPAVANSAFLIGPNQEIEGRYDKVRLLPFDEYVPLREWVSWPAWITGLRHDATPGTQPGTLETAGLRYGVLICFESLFATEGRRAASQGIDFLVTLTNETFAASASSHEQLLAMNLFRAAENGMPLVRATTTTISAIVGADGNVLERGGAGDGVLVADIPGPSPPTLYTRHGDLPVLALAALAAAVMFARPKPTTRSSAVSALPASSDSGRA
jgi:apolipoprotein N-acyltransferase